MEFYKHKATSLQFIDTRTNSFLRSLISSAAYNQNGGNRLVNLLSNLMMEFIINPSCELTSRLMQLIIRLKLLSRTE